jgi:dihydroorotate dehydrogenase
MYDLIVKRLLFKLQPETAHDLVRHLGAVVNIAVISDLFRRYYQVNDPRLVTCVAGISFPNPIGLAAGFDKNVELLGLWRGLGFGHVELGTVTAEGQPGNPRPRIFRLPADRALINRMGFPSHGADIISARLTRAKRRFNGLPVLGINIGKSKVTEIDRAIEDYCYSFSRLASSVDYVTVNVSSPNTPNLRQLQERDRLLALLRALQGMNSEGKPVFVKVAPDLTFEALEEVLEVCIEARVAGIIATNTTIARDGIKTTISETGGLSGAPLFKRSLDVVRFLANRAAGRCAIIGVGGIASFEDVLEMMAAGAAMVQVYTGLVYGGPDFVRSINLGLVRFMDKHSCGSLADAVRVWRESSNGANTGFCRAG